VREIRYALRSLSKQPAFCFSAILTLALGIGATTAMFSVFDAVILHPLPYRDPGRLVLVWQSLSDREPKPVQARNYIEWSKQADSFERLLAIRTQFVALRSAGESHQLLGAQVSRGFFSELGIAPGIGREFLPGEQSADQDHVAVLSYKLWQREFGSRRAVLGTPMILNGESYTVIGIAAANFDESLALRGIDVWTPIAPETNADSPSHNMCVMGRLKRSVTLDQADREMQVIAKRLEVEYPATNRGWSVLLAPLEEYGIGKLRATIAALLAAVGMVLLIACVNVANLLLARSEVRHKEAAIRAALGASRARLLKQLLTETMLLACAGSAGGITLAYFGLQLLRRLQAVQLPGLASAGLNVRALAFTIAITALTGLLFGLFPSRTILGGDLNQTIRESGRGTTNTRRGGLSRSLLVICEIALSLIVLAGAGLMARSVRWLQNENRGFLSDHLFTFRLSFLPSDFPTASAMGDYQRNLLARISALPGVRSVASGANLPLDGFVLVGQFFRVPGAAESSPDRQIAACNLINAGYFQALGIPSLQGREFEARDRDGASPVAVISQSLARRYFPGENPVGRKIIVPSPGKSNIEVAREIVGVAGDVRYLTRPGEESLEIYLPYLQTPWPNLYVMVRTLGDPSAFAPELRAVLRDPQWNRESVADLMTMQDRISALNDKPRLNSRLASLFALLALLLAAVGIYGVVSYSTSRRAPEIGIRLALGAVPRDIIGWILKQALVVASIGLALGLAGYFALSRALAGVLYGVSPTDGVSLVGSVLILAGIALVASYIPARRAVRVDPVAALRSE